MNFTDFVYDNMYLSDFGCIICTFDSNGGTETTTGSNITFNTVPVMNGKHHMMTSSAYGSCLEAEFQICKDPCDIKDQSDMYFDIYEQSQIRRWLNRMDFHKLKLINEDGEYHTFYYEGSFNVDTVKHSGNVIGFNLRFTSNKPFAIGNEKTIKFQIDANDGQHTLIDCSDEIGYLYLDVEIRCNSDGVLRIRNTRDNRTTEIRNCKTGEVIKITDMVIESSDAEHSSAIMDDFNFVFPTIINDLRDRKNTYSFSMPCEVIFKYRPIRKVGI